MREAGRKWNISLRMGNFRIRNSMEADNLNFINLIHVDCDDRHAVIEAVLFDIKTKTKLVVNHEDIK